MTMARTNRGPQRRLRHEVTLQAPLETENALGDVLQSWNAVGSFCALVIPLAGKELEKARGIIAEATHEVWIRYSPEIQQKRRLVHRGRYLNISYVANIEECDRWSYAICVEEVAS